MQLGKYSFGTGDRFAHQGKAQLAASIKAQEAGIEITHMWNKSNREHLIVKSSPDDVRKEADEAVNSLGWKGQYLVDADHINLSNVDKFIASSDFFTIDVADYIGKKAEESELKAFVESLMVYEGSLKIDGIESSYHINRDFLRSVAEKYLFAALEAGKIYRHIVAAKGGASIIPEVSMDEVNDPQTPDELFFILAAIAKAGVPAQTIAPKFTGRFNKGVDYVGDVKKFSTEFEEDLLVISKAINEFGLPANLKLSVHSGSDKFSIYKPIRELTSKHGAGVHVKTAGTTWLEELIGLAESEGEGLEIARKVYEKAMGRFDELTGPYSTVIDVHKENLPTVEEVNTWLGAKIANTLRHEQQHPDFNPEFRQLIHCSFKVAAEMGKTYTDALVKYQDVVAKNVTYNLYERHLKPLFIEK
ncbi:MAG: tagaturonate epimerase family protein [Cyclobacteriaceae bacterium]